MGRWRRWRRSVPSMGWKRESGHGGMASHKPRAYPRGRRHHRVAATAGNGQHFDAPPYDDGGEQMIEAAEGRKAGWRRKKRRRCNRAKGKPTHVSPFWSSPHFLPTLLPTLPIHADAPSPGIDAAGGSPAPPLPTTRLARFELELARTVPFASSLAPAILPFTSTSGVLAR